MGLAERGINMDRWQAQYAFWSSFGVPAYEENSVPDNPVFPYITYESAASAFDDDYFVNASVWTRSTSWAQADALSDAIEQNLTYGGKVLPYTGGMIWVTLGAPFAQSMGDPEDGMIKRKRLSVLLHFV